MRHVPETRIRNANEGDFNSAGEYVLYWMTAFRRREWNFGLQRAADWARDLKKPLVVFEALRCNYRWASDRVHSFVIQGMADNAKRLSRKSVLYYPYLELSHNAGKGLLDALAKRACVVVSDDFPCFFLPRMLSAAARRIFVRFELVDSNGILPMRAADRVFARAVDFRRFLQKNLRSHLDAFPDPNPLAGVRLPKLNRLPASILRKWPPAEPDDLAGKSDLLRRLPIDRTVGAASIVGGAQAAQRTLRDFLNRKLSKYETSGNQPEQEVTSGLSPYLHFGHISAHQVFHETMNHDDWTPAKIAEKASGSSTGWWGASPDVEAFTVQQEYGRIVICGNNERLSSFQRHTQTPQVAQSDSPMPA